MDKPLISVIVPVYNVEKYLPRCIESIIGQTYKNLEIILVDDGSTDFCGKICDEYAACDDRIKVIHKQNGGQGEARNYGMDIMTGEYVGFVDGDDWISPRMYEDMLKFLTENKADAAECAFDMVYGESEGIEPEDAETELLSFDRRCAVKELLREKLFHNTVPNKFFRKDVIGSVRFEPGKIHEDILWPYLIFARSDKVIYVGAAYYHYFQREGSTVHQKYSRRKFDALDAAKARADCIKTDFPDLYVSALDSYIHECFFHYQWICREKECDPNGSLRREIRERIKAENIKPLYKIKRKFKYQIWFVLFANFPSFTSFVRNTLKIGL